MNIKPFFILNLSNIDFFFNYLNNNHYLIGYGKDSGYNNDNIKKQTIKDLHEACEIKYNSNNEKYEEYRITFIELDEKRKRYIITSQWTIDKNIIKFLLNINDLTKFTSIPRSMN